jgi:hypothetical protein
MKFRIILTLLLAIISANCSKKKDDNSLRNLLVLGILSQSRAETVSLTAGVALRQEISVTAGQEFTYTITQPSASSSSLLSRATSLDNRILTSILDTDNQEVARVLTVPGLTEKITYMPKKTGSIKIAIIPRGSGSITTNITGGTASNSLSSQNSSTLALTGKRKYAIAGAILTNSGYSIVNVDEITSIKSDGTIVKKSISDAIVTFTVDGVTVTVNYGINPANSDPCFIATSINGYAPGKKVRLRVTHPTISDINFDKEIAASPSPVSNVKVNGISSSKGSGTTLTIDKTAPLIFTWELPTSNQPPTTQISFNRGDGTDIFLFFPADKLTYTVPKELLTGLTSTSTTDDCIGSIGGAGSTWIYDTDYFIGLDSGGNSFPSSLSILSFNLFNSSVPNTGYFCETGKANPLAPFGGAAVGTTYNSAGVPLLVVK